MKTKIIVITGGVYSSLGKGIVASSIGCILKHGGFKIAMLKLDPYLNTDPGLLSPIQHGEVFITEDGQKTDLDLGHYERFTGINLTRAATQTGGKLYTEILNEEKQGKFNGATIQVIPHLTNKIMQKIDYAIKKSNHPDFLIVEIGGTVGDIESLSFIEAMRLYNVKHNNVLFVHCSPLFQLNANDEIKTKPTQHSVKNLRNLGIHPHILVLRFSHLISEKDKQKLSWTCDINEKDIFVSKDCKYLYEVPKILYDQGIHLSILRYFKMKKSNFNMKDWDDFLKSIYAKKNKKANICICGEYTELNDSYLSLIESLKFASWKNNVDLNIELINYNDLSSKSYEKQLAQFDGFIIPDGAYHDKIKQSMDLVIKYALEHKKPLLGIKLGMQLIYTFFGNSTKDIIKTKEFYDRFLGNQTITILPNTKMAKVYSTNEVNERHWNNWLIKEIINNDLKVAAVNNQYEIEIIEHQKHPFLVGTLFHPEYTSKPNMPHPIFNEFIKKAIH